MKKAEVVKETSNLGSIQNGPTEEVSEDYTVPRTAEGTPETWTTVKDVVKDRGNSEVEKVKPWTETDPENYVPVSWTTEKAFTVVNRETSTKEGPITTWIGIPSTDPV